MTGQILQISTSRGGVPKRAVPEALLERRGFQGDSWAHPAIHGGRRQAVLIVASEALDQLTARGYPVFPGALGENLTTVGLDRAQMRIGQQYRVGMAAIEITKLRSPCRTLDIYGRDSSGVAIQNALYDSAVGRGDFTSSLWGLGGFYARVVTEGLVRAGDSIILESDLA